MLVLAAIGLLLVDPFLLHQVGFLLSCGASLGIALLARPITARLRGPRWMREVLGVTAAAQVGVAPVLIPVFGSMPLVALPANLLAVPLAAPLTMWGLVAGVVGGLGRPLSPAIPRLLELPTVGLLHVLDLGRRPRGPRCRSRSTVAPRGVVVALGALLGAAHRARRLRGRCPGSATASVTRSTTSPHARS